MTEKIHSLKREFERILKKVAAFTEAEVEALCLVMGIAGGDPRFSLVRASHAKSGMLPRKKLATLLIKYASVQDHVAEELCRHVVMTVGRRPRYVVSVDDQLVPKRGLKMYGVRKWFDHVTRRTIHALCIVDLVIVVHGQRLLAVPYLLTRTTHHESTTPTTAASHALQQDAKSVAALGLISKVVTWLTTEGLRRNRISVVEDSWYSNRTVIATLRQNKVSFRVDAKKNYQVPVPDFGRIKTTHHRKRGRRPTRFVKYVQLEEYFQSVSTGGSFEDSQAGVTVRYKVATVTLKTTGRVRVHAFWRNNATNAKYILTPAVRQHPPTAETVYEDYRGRWPVEEAHRDVKQHFGLGKCRNRRARVIWGFIGLVHAWYSIFLIVRWRWATRGEGWYTAPQFHDTILRYLYQDLGVVLGS